MSFGGAPGLANRFDVGAACVTPDQTGVWGSGGWLRGEGGGKGTYNATDIGLDQALGHEVGMFLGQTRLEQEPRGEILSLAGLCVVAGLGRHCLFDLGWEEEDRVLTTMVCADSHYRSVKACPLDFDVGVRVG